MTRYRKRRIRRQRIEATLLYAAIIGGTLLAMWCQYIILASRPI